MENGKRTSGEVDDYIELRYNFFRYRGSRKHSEATNTMPKSTGATNPSEMLPLTPAVFHIMLALSADALHGYAIMGEVERLSEGTVTMGPGTLYGTIKRLRVQGLVEESEERPDPEDDDERRRYYRLTGLGERVLAAEVVRVRRMISNAGGLGLQPGVGRA